MLKSEVKGDISRRLDTSLSFLPVGRVYADKIGEISDIISVSPLSPPHNPLQTEERSPREPLRELEMNRPQSNEVTPRVKRRQATGTFIAEIESLLTDIGRTEGGGGRGEGL